MTENEIIRKISYNNDRIGACRADIRNLENQIAQLGTLRGKVQNLHSNFSNRQSRRRAKLSNMYSASKRNKNIVNRYTSAMSDLLNGSEYNNASNGLSAAVERINEQIRSLGGKVQSNYNAINQYNRNVDYWNRKLSDLRKKNKVKKK